MDEKKPEGSCSSGCGPRCGCCVCKAVKALVLLLVGGLIGFYMGRHCGSGRMCSFGSRGEAMKSEAPAAPAPAAAKKAK